MYLNRKILVKKHGLLIVIKDHLLVLLLETLYLCEL